MNPIEDEKILSIIRVEGRVDEGFKMLMDKYKSKVYHQILRIVTTPSHADDVVQNTFVKIYRNIDRFKGNSALYTWIYRIASNESFNFLKNEKKKMAETLDQVHYGSLHSESYFDESAAQRALDKAIKGLPKRQKMVFNYRYFEELSYKDIAEIMEVSQGSLKASYHHAVKKIEAQLQNMNMT